MEIAPMDRPQPAVSSSQMLRRAEAQARGGRKARHGTIEDKPLDDGLASPAEEDEPTRPAYAAVK